MIGFTGQIWRRIRPGQDPSIAEVTAEGMFHHSGQIALYAGLSAKDEIARQRPYAHPDDPAYLLATLTVDLQRVVDLGEAADQYLDWHDTAAKGVQPTSWIEADACRHAGADAVFWTIYGARCLTIFSPPNLVIRSIGPTTPFPATPATDPKDLYH